MQGNNFQQNKNIKVLAAPAAVHFTDEINSISQISYKLISLLSEQNVEYLAIVNNVSVEKIFNKVSFLEMNNFFRYDFFRIKFFLNVSSVAKKAMKREDIDLIHHIGPFAYGTGFNFLPTFSGKKIIVGPVEVPHKFLDDDFKYLYNYKYSEVIYIFARIVRSLFSVPIWRLFLKTINNCDIIIAVNEETKNHFKGFVDESKVRVVPLGVDLSEFQFTLPPDNHEILAGGVHIKRKGFDYLIKAMSEIIKKFPDSRLHLIGDGPQKSKLKLLAQELGAEKNIVFHGRIPRNEVIELFKKCRVFCHPSLSEAFSPIRLEAMATGRPIVATTAASGASEMIENAKTGFLVPPANSAELANKLIWVLDDYDLTCKIGKEARNKVENTYSWEVVAKKYYEIYVDALESNQDD